MNAKTVKFKEEFKRGNLKWDCSPQNFLLYQWQSTDAMDVYYVVYRVMFAMLAVLFIAASWRYTNIATAAQKFQSLAYLTSWSIMAGVAYAFLAAIVVARAYQLRRKGKDLETPCLYKALWMVQVIAVDMNLAVTTVFYFFINIRETGNLTTLWSKYVHLWNSVLMLEDLLINAIPQRLYHVYLTISFSLVYSLFNYLYYYFGGRSPTGKAYLYKMINWEKAPGNAVLFVAAGCAFLLAVRLAVFGIHCLKVKVYRRFYEEREDEAAKETGV